MELINRFLLCVSLLSAETLYALNKLHIHRNFHLQHVYAIPILAELAHALGHNLRLFLRVFQTLFIRAFFVTNKFQKVRNVIGPALIANALHPRMLLIVHFLGIERSVIKQNLHAVRARLFQPPRRPVIQQISQPPRPGLVVTRLFISQQQPRILRPPLRSRQSPLRVEQYRAGMRSQYFGHQYFELFHHGVADFPALFFGERFLQRSALIHRRRRNHSAFIRYFSKTRKFARGKLHRFLQDRPRR